MIGAYEVHVRTLYSDIIYELLCTGTDKNESTFTSPVKILYFLYESNVTFKIFRIRHN